MFPRPAAASTPADAPTTVAFVPHRTVQDTDDGGPSCHRTVQDSPLYVEQNMHLLVVLRC